MAVVMMMFVAQTWGALISVWMAQLSGTSTSFVGLGQWACFLGEFQG
jgi:hypothetical protein